LAAFVVALVCFGNVQKADAEPIVFVVSYHNIDYAETACRDVLSKEASATETMRNASQYRLEVPDWVSNLLAGARECKSVTDPRQVGRRLENELLNALALNTSCAGVTVIRDPHPKYDGGGWSQTNRKIRDQKAHWDLHLDFRPGEKTYAWWLFSRSAGSMSWNAIIDGQGETPKVANDICVAVSGRGATIQ
jgi:hypothetical protein